MSRHVRSTRFGVSALSGSAECNNSAAASCLGTIRLNNIDYDIDPHAAFDNIVTAESRRRQRRRGTGINTAGLAGPSLCRTDLACCHPLLNPSSK